MNETSLSERVLALAGVFQATSLVRQIAQHGTAEEAAFVTSIRSVLRIDAQGPQEVFDDPGNVSRGLRILRQELSGGGERDKEITRYVVNLMHLERKMVGRVKVVQHLREGLLDAQRQAQHLGPTHASVLARLADIYQETISTLGPRILVHGEPAHLEGRENANRIRALLLAGIRATVLWRQCGGTRINLLFSRNVILRTASALLARPSDPESGDMP